MKKISRCVQEPVYRSKTLIGRISPSHSAGLRFSPLNAQAEFPAVCPSGPGELRPVSSLMDYAQHPPPSPYWSFYSSCLHCLHSQWGTQHFPMSHFSFLFKSLSNCPLLKQTCSDWMCMWAVFPDPLVSCSVSIVHIMY